MIRYWNSNRRVEYVCKGYHGHGKEFCSSLRVHEEMIDVQVMEYAELPRQCWQTEQAELREEIRQDEEDIDELLMLKIQREK